MKIIKKTLLLIVWLVLLVAAALAILIGIAALTDYKPAQTEAIGVSGTPSQLPDSATLTLLTWNLGFGGLGEEMDFFYDGGKRVNTTEERCLENIAGIRRFIEANDSVDFILCQEVDVNSRRSYRRNEVDTLSGVLSRHLPFFAKNYDVFFVPRPFTEPIGKVLSGITVHSRYTPSASARVSLPGKLGFPTWLFYLDRCFIVNRYQVSNGKELVLINTHNEAYDEGGVRILQMNFLRDFFLREYEKGNYVIAGGDWNQSPPRFTPAFRDNVVKENQMQMEENLMPEGWHWIYDPSVPTNRSIDIPYDKKITTTTVIDYFLASPNVIPLEVKGIHLEFRHSDHHPALARVKLQ